MNNRAKPTDLDLTDDEIEALALKHIAPGYERLRAVVPEFAPYQQSEQFRRVKALLADALNWPRAPVADERGEFQRLWPEIHTAGHAGGWRGVAWAAWSARAALASAPVAGEPFMYGIMGPDGKAHFEEFCVSGDRSELQAEVVDHLNRDNPEGGTYSVVALFRDAAPQGGECECSRKSKAVSDSEAQL